MKKLISVALALMMVLSLSVVAFAADTCIVAGVSALCGSNWDPSDSSNAMTLKSGVYEKTYKNVPAGDYQFKVVHNGTWMGSNGNNVMFSVSAPCDVTITFNPANGSISYTGANIGKTAFKVNGIYAVGAAVSAAPTWLNGKNWDPAAAANKMTEVSTGVYAIIYANLTAGKYEFKFAADGTWDHSWGGSFTEFDKDADIAYNGGNITFELAEKKDVTLVLDLSNFSLDAGGAKYKIALSAPGTAVLPTPGDDNTGDDNTGDDNTGDDNTGDTTTEAYFVAGVETLCGVAWKENDANNAMTKGADGVWTKTYTKVAAGEYSVKVTDGTWDNSWGGEGENGNYDFTVEAEADVTVKFDAAAKTVTVEVAGKSGDSGNTGNDNTGDNNTGDNNNNNNDNNNNNNNNNKPSVNLPTDGNDSVTTLFVKVPADWSAVNAYAWSDSNDKVLGEWPGAALTAKDGDWYKIALTEAATGFVINNGSVQSIDVEVKAGKDVYITVTETKNAEGKHEATAQYADGSTAGGDNMGSGEAADDVITGTESNFRVVGNADWMGNWDPASDAGRMLEVAPGVYKQNFDNVQPGNYELKITQNGTWDKSWGTNGNNFCFTVSQACKITVTFTLDGDNGTISVKGIGINNAGTADVNMISVVVLMGLAVCAAGILIVNKKKFI